MESDNNLDDDLEKARKGRHNGLSAGSSSAPLPYSSLVHQRFKSFKNPLGNHAFFNDVREEWEILDAILYVTNDNIDKFKMFIVLYLT